MKYVLRLYITRITRVNWKFKLIISMKMKSLKSSQNQLCHFTSRTKTDDKFSADSAVPSLIAASLIVKLQAFEGTASVNVTNDAACHVQTDRELIDSLKTDAGDQSKEYEYSHIIVVTPMMDRAECKTAIIYEHYLSKNRLNLLLESLAFRIEQ